MTIDAQKRDEFLLELTALSKKYRIAIGGCGCCSSPFLLEFDEHEWSPRDGGRYCCDHVGELSEIAWINDIEEVTFDV